MKPVRDRALVSAVTATLVFVALAAERIAEYGIAVTLSGQFYGFPIVDLFLSAAPFAVGFFLSLWIIAPITKELGIPRVVARAILATGIASVVVFVVVAGYGVLDSLTVDGDPFANSFPSLRVNDVPLTLTQGLSTAAVTFVQTLPLGVLAGILLWLWGKSVTRRIPDEV